jgi:hypothetical protein
MRHSHYSPAKTVKAIALLLSFTAIMPGLSASSASAQIFRSAPSSILRTNEPSSPSLFSQTLVIPAGTNIPVQYEEAEKILVTRQETLPLTVTVAANIRDRNGNLLIPFGSEIVGQIQPADNGSQFVAEYIILGQDREISLDASSRVITRTEVVDEGADAVTILQGTLVGTAAATLIAAVTGDTAIATEEVLAGAALGTLGGWLFGGGQTELISINPNTDLTLTLQSPLDIQ